MDNNTTFSLAEIKAEIEELQARLKALEDKIAEYESVPDVPADFTDIEIAVGELPEPEDEMLAEPVKEVVPEPVKEVVPEPVKEVVSEPVEEDLPEAVEEDLPEAGHVVAPAPESEPAHAPEVEPAPVAATAPSAEPAPAPAPEPEPAPAKKSRKKAEPKADAPAKPYAWMLDVPPVRVKNIRSAISLQDRALFIKALFKEDFALYDSTIGALNAMESAEEASAYIKENFPDWNLRSDIVYGFMMAVRKKLG